MTLAYVFATICGVFVLAVLVLAFWTVMVGLRDESKFRKQHPVSQNEKPAPTNDDEKPAD